MHSFNFREIHVVKAPPPTANLNILV